MLPLMQLRACRHLHGLAQPVVDLAHSTLEQVELQWLCQYVTLAAS
jgi:hypothetical protein